MWGGWDYARRIEVIRQHTGLISLLAFEGSSQNQELITNVNIVKEEKKSAELNLADYLKNNQEKLLQIYQIDAQDSLTLGNYQAAKIILQFSQDKKNIKQLLYIINKQNNFWLVT